MQQYDARLKALFHKQVPRQVLLYVGPEPLTMPSVYRWEFGLAQYTLVDIRDLDGDALLASREPGDNVIGILARLKDRSRAVRTIVERLLHLDREQSTTYARALLILAGLRPGLAAQVKEAMMFEFDPAILENEVLGPIYRDGVRQGIIRRKVGRPAGGV